MPLFCENVTGFGDVSLGEAVLKSYADFNGLTSHDCKELGIEPGKCGVLQQELTRVEQDKFYPYYGQTLGDSFCNAGFSSDFTTALVGDDGRKAFSARIKWFSEKSVTDVSCDDKGCGMRPEVIEKLGKVTENSSFNILPLLEKLIRDDDQDVSGAAISVLAQNRLEVNSVIAKLAKEEGRELLAISIISNLHCYSDNTKTANSLLVQSARSPDVIVRRAAVRIMRPSYVENHRKVLLNALNDTDAEVRSIALGQLSFRTVTSAISKEEAMSAKPALMNMLKDSDWNVRRLALELLGASDSLETSDLETLFKLLIHDSMYSVRNEAYDQIYSFMMSYVHENYPFANVFQLTIVTKIIADRCKSEDPNWKAPRPSYSNYGYGPGAQ